MKDIADSYFNALRELLSYFGVQEEWHFYPIVDLRSFNWYIEEGILYYGFGDRKFSARLFIHPDNKNSVFRRLSYTAVCLEFYTSRVIAILDNAKEITAWKIAQSI